MECERRVDQSGDRLVVNGPDGYVSPDWYAVDDQVPTWNYVAVHLTGRLEALPETDLDPMLARQSAFYEEQLDKAPWTMDKMQPETRARMQRMILPFRLSVEDVQSTFKLSQNKPDPVRSGAADHIATGFGSELSELERLMRGVMPGD